MRLHWVSGFLVLAIVAGTILSARSQSPAQPRKLKVHISVDMEGVAGTVTADQLSPTGFEYGRYREFMTREALAAVNAVKRPVLPDRRRRLTATARTC